eukprot:5389672-Prymnesium_polylepis.2
MQASTRSRKPAGRLHARYTAPERAGQPGGESDQLGARRMLHYRAVCGRARLALACCAARWEGVRRHQPEARPARHAAGGLACRAPFVDRRATAGGRQADRLVVR